MNYKLPVQEIVGSEKNDTFAQILLKAAMSILWICQQHKTDKCLHCIQCRGNPNKHWQQSTEQNIHTGTFQCKLKCICIGHIMGMVWEITVSSKMEQHIRSIFWCDVRHSARRRSISCTVCFVRGWFNAWVKSLWLWYTCWLCICRLCSICWRYCTYLCILL